MGSLEVIVLHVLRDRSPEVSLAECQAAVRRSVRRIVIDAADRRLRIDLHVLPVGLDGPAPGSTETVTVTF